MPLFAVYSSNNFLLAMKTLPGAYSEMWRMFAIVPAVQFVNGH